jgi:hypothetical protein
MAHQPCTARHARIARTTNKLPTLTNSGTVANRTPCHAPRRVSPSPSIWKEHLQRKPAFLSLVLAATLFSWVAPRQQSSAPSDRKASSDSPFTAHDHAKMNERSEKGMTFSQTATVHRFLLKPDGGIIQVAANDPKDSDSIDHIRKHLAHISHAFSSGDFDIPLFVYDTVPPGVPDMKRFASKITYTAVQTPNGGRVDPRSRRHQRDSQIPPLPD